MESDTSDWEKLETDFVNVELERAVIAAVARDRNLFWRIAESVDTSTFSVEGLAWQAVAVAIQNDDRVMAPAEWQPSANPEKDVAILVELARRRETWSLLHRTATELQRSERVAVDVAGNLARAAGDLQLSMTSHRKVVKGTADLLNDSVREIARRYALRNEMETEVFGLATGFQRLDAVIGGFQPGLFFLSGEPGIGKTTFALQIARQVVASGTPVLFVTFEERAERLSLKAICGVAGESTKKFEDGIANPDTLRAIVAKLGPVLVPLHFLEGRADTTTAEIRQRARQAMAKSSESRCLVIVDYVQHWARTRQAAEVTVNRDLRQIVTAICSDLREDVVKELNCPVLCVSSQGREENREGWNMALSAGDDLEYDADAIMYLASNDIRGTYVGYANPGTSTRAVDVKIAKNRFGEVGNIEMVFRPELGSFHEVVNGPKGATVRRGITIIKPQKTATQ